MSKIQPIEKIHIWDNSQKSLQICVKSKATKHNKHTIQNILQEIHNAKETIFIASTSPLDENIKDALIERIQSKVRIYGITKEFKSFNAFGWFGKQFPFLCRQCPELKNDYIIIDKKNSFLFLKQSENFQLNTPICLNEQETKDLSYWFIHFFWTKCDRESINGKPDVCKSAPFAAPSLRKEYIPLKNSDFQSKETFYAKQPNSRVLIKKEHAKNYEAALQSSKLSDQLKEPIYKNEKFWAIGDFLISTNTFTGLEDIWQISESTLENAPTEFIDFNSDKWDLIQKQSKTEQNYGEIKADLLEEMNNKDLSNDELKAKAEPYSEKTIFHFRVLPPQKPNGTKPAKIYSDFEKLQSNYKSNLTNLNRSLTDLLEKAQKNGTNIGVRQEIEEFLNECRSDLNKDLRKMALAELEDCLKKWNDESDQNNSSNCFFKFYDLDYRVREDEYDKNKKSTLAKLKNEESDIKKEIEKKTKELSDINVQLENLTKKEPTETDIKAKKDLEQTKNPLTNELERLKNSLTKNQEQQKSEVEKSFTRVPYSERKKKIKKELSFSPLEMPAFLLPEVGKLFEDSKNFYLEISDWDELSQAKDLANRYNKNKTYHIVAKA